MSVDFKMGCQDDQDDNVHQNMRTVSMWSNTVLEPGWGWVHMVRFFPHNGSTQHDFTTLDISPSSAFAKEIETFLHSPFDFHNYELCKQLLTQYNFSRTTFGNDYGPIRYGIYDLCAINLDSDSFITNMYEAQQTGHPDANFTFDKMKHLVSLAKILRKAVIKHIVAYKQCSHYKIANQIAYMHQIPGQASMQRVHQIPGQASVQQGEPEANPLYWIPATVANEYEDKNHNKKTYINFPLLLQALHANHALYDATRNQILKSCAHVDVYETASHNTKIKFKMEWACMHENDETIPQKMRDLLMTGQSDMRTQFALETTCDFLTTCAMAMVEDRSHIYHKMHEFQHQQALQYQQQMHQQQMQQMQQQQMQQQQMQQQQMKQQKAQKRKGQKPIHDFTQQSKQEQQEIVQRHWYNTFLGQLGELEAQINEKDADEQYKYTVQNLQDTLDEIRREINKTKKQNLFETQRQTLFQKIRELQEMTTNRQVKYDSSPSMLGDSENSVDQ